jgi:hypothetical protein
VPCEDDVLSLWHWLQKFGLKQDLTKKYAGHIQYYSRSSLRQEVERAGLPIKKIRYGEHFFGQLLNVLSFNLMNHAAQKRGVSQMNNETYFDQLEKNTSRTFLQGVKNLVNGVVNIESQIFSRISSPNVHVVAVKK